MTAVGQATSGRAVAGVVDARVRVHPDDQAAPLRSAVLLVAVLALAGATGCSGSNSDENAYVDQLNKVQNDFASSVAKALSSEPSQLDGKAQAIQSLGGLETAMDKLIADLKVVDPPSKVESLHHELISEMQRFHVHVQDAVASLTSSDPQVIVDAQAQVATEAGQFGTTIRKTISGINDKLQE
jgi:hypothetical protein